MTEACSKQSLSIETSTERFVNHGAEGEHCFAPRTATAPHPEEPAKRASRRMAAGDSRAFMVRDGADAPPHHEGLKLFPIPPAGAELVVHVGRGRRDHADRLLVPGDRYHDL